MTQATASPAVRTTTAYAGLGTLLGVALRRDRWRLPIAVLGVSAFEMLMAGSLIGVYPSAADRAGQLTTIDNPGSTFLLGPPYHVQDYNHGVMIGHQTLIWIAALTSVLAVLTVIRHTRAEEEAGRTELLRAAQVGLRTPLAAGVAVAALQVVLTGIGVAAGQIALEATSVDATGAIVFGSAVTATGLVFAGIAALTAQLVETGRAAGALATIALAAAFLCGAPATSATTPSAGSRRSAGRSAPTRGTPTISLRSACPSRSPSAVSWSRRCSYAGATSERRRGPPDRAGRPRPGRSGPAWGW